MEFFGSLIPIIIPFLILICIIGFTTEMFKRKG